MNVAIVGASDKPDRYSYKALIQLKAAGHKVYPVHIRFKEIEGVPVYPSLADISDPIDTITLYVGQDVSSLLAELIIAKKPKRIIFNPGAENEALAGAASAAGIETVNACTLVMLRTGQFGK